MPLEYHPTDYEFPQLYVEGGRGRPITVYPEKGFYVRGEARGGTILNLEVYEEVAWGRVVDVIGAVIMNRAAVVIPWKGGKALFLDKGMRVDIVEVYGRQVAFQAREGDYVDGKSVLAYVLTGRGDTRSVRAGVEGVVALIAWDQASYPPRYAYIIVPQGREIWLEPRDEL